MILPIADLGIMSRLKCAVTSSVEPKNQMAE